MKTLTRIAIILLAAVLVVGATAALIDGRAGAGGPANATTDARPSDEFQPGRFQGEHGDHDGGASGLTVLIKNASVFAGLTLVVAGVSTVSGRLRRKA